jgi:Iap family predicted aminopeptidase
MDLNFYMKKKEEYNNKRVNKCIEKKVLDNFNAAMEALRNEKIYKKKYTVCLNELYCGKENEDKIIIEKINQKMGNLKDFVQFKKCYYGGGY